MDDIMPKSTERLAHGEYLGNPADLSQPSVPDRTYYELNSENISAGSMKLTHKIKKKS